MPAPDKHRAPADATTERGSRSPFMTHAAEQRTSARVVRRSEAGEEGCKQASSWYRGKMARPT